MAGRGSEKQVREELEFKVIPHSRRDDDVVQGVLLWDSIVPSI